MCPQLGAIILHNNCIFIATAGAYDIYGVGAARSCISVSPSPYHPHPRLLIPPPSLPPLDPGGRAKLRPVHDPTGTWVSRPSIFQGHL